MSTAAAGSYETSVVFFCVCYDSRNVVWFQVMAGRYRGTAHFCVTTQPVVVNSCRLFGTIYPSSYMFRNCDLEDGTDRFTETSVINYRPSQRNNSEQLISYSCKWPNCRTIPFSICLFQFSTCFEQHRAHHQENQLCQYNIWYVSLCVGDRLVCRSGRKFLT
jgi:hypothetical protein